MSKMFDKHPDYGPCDSLRPDGSCAECHAREVGYRGPDPVKSRDQNEHYIKNLFWDTSIGEELIGRLTHEFGMSAFTDEAIARLAQLHRDREEQEITASLRRK